MAGPLRSLARDLAVLGPWAAGALLQSRLIQGVLVRAVQRLAR
ncbi:MAG TPA: hypothetical protein VHH36_02070 [Candidatus Thermoplasmatota archaeon]|nr:hypothetical protein [Candidatus Thermoplasmatota archaeon]